jgi:hypothetical protein
LNHKTLELIVKVGILESYQPDEEIRALHADVEQVRHDAEEQLKTLYGNDATTAQIVEIFKKDPIKATPWKEYLKELHGVRLRQIKDKIDLKNRQLCANYEEFTNSVIKPSSEEKKEIE